MNPTVKPNFSPTVGQKIPVTLPNEITRAEVIEVRSDDEVVVALTVQAPMAKTHDYKYGDTLACRRRQGLGGIDKWEVVSRG
jgi:hypothetical protein